MRSILVSPRMLTEFAIAALVPLLPLLLLKYPVAELAEKLVDLEDAFAYVMFRLLSRTGERGQPRPPDVSTTRAAV